MSDSCLVPAFSKLEINAVYRAIRERRDMRNFKGTSVAASWPTPAAALVVSHGPMTMRCMRNRWVQAEMWAMDAERGLGVC